PARTRRTSSRSGSSSMSPSAGETHRRAQRLHGPDATGPLAGASNDRNAGPFQGETPMTAMTFAFVLPIVALVAAFSFVSVAHWVEGRKKEREAFYRSEVLKKLAETTGPQAQQILDLLREEERNVERRRREGQRLGGLIVTVVGIGLGLMLALLAPKEPAWA